MWRRITARSLKNPMFADAREICEEVLGKYASGEIGEILSCLHVFQEYRRA